MSGGGEFSRPVVFLHGWTMRGAIFAPLIARLGPGVEAHAPDLPGHGDASDEEPSLAACVDRLARVIEATGRDDVLLVGWSFGAAVAWSYLARHGTGRAAGLVTVDMSPKPVNGPGWTLGLLGQERGRLERATEEIHSDWPRAAEKIATTMFARREGAPGYGRDAALAQILSNDPAAMARLWDEMLGLDLRAEVAEIDVPWLVTCGGRSRVYPGETAAWLARTGPRASLHGFAQSGHSPHLEEPDAFARALRDFEAGLTGTS